VVKQIPNAKKGAGVPVSPLADPHNKASDKAAGKPKGTAAQAAAAVAAAIANAPSKSKGGFVWEAALADYLGIAYNAKTKLFFDSWNTIDNSAATNNPFNITIDYTGGSTGKLSGNPDGVLNFDTPLDGIRATAAFILRRTPNIKDALKAGDYQGAAAAVGASGWAPKDPTYGNSLWRTFKTGSVHTGSNAPSSDLSPKAKAQVSVEGATLRAQSEAGNAAYIQSTVDVAAQKKVAEETAHVTDPWIVVVNGKGGTKFSYGTGMNPPKNVLMYGGQPVTKSDYTTIWGTKYAGIYEDYTGRVPTPADVAYTLGKGLTPYGLQAYLASLPGFTSSPIYKKEATDINQLSIQILGTNAPEKIIQQAISEGWTQTQLEANLRQQPDYLQGPEFTDKYAAMKAVYQQIYGQPDANANQTIKQVAANGWDTNAFANYLRTQPEYKTSLEYQDNTVNLLDKLGLILRGPSTLAPVPASGLPTGGKPVPTSPLVPGGAKPLNPVLPYQPTLTATPPDEGGEASTFVRPQGAPEVPVGVSGNG
jgi:hypothetical protein